MSPGGGKQALAVLARRLRRLEEVSGALVTEVGPDGRLTYASENHRDIIGYGPDELVGKHHQAIQMMIGVSDPPDLPVSLEVLTGLAASEELRTLHRVRRKDGTTRWLESDVTTYESSAGTHLLSVSRELTTVPEAEGARLESEARLLSVQRIANVGSWEWYPDSGRFELSSECQRILGLEAARGGHRDILEWIHPDDRLSYELAIDEALERGTLDIEFRYRRPGLEPQVVRTRGEWVAVGQAEPRIFGTVHDVTETCRAEAAARESQRRLNQILTSLPTTQIVVWGEDCRARAVYSGTNAHAYGLTAERAQGSVAGEFLPETRREQGLENLKSVFATGETVHAREATHLPAGTFVFDVSMSPLRDRSGQITDVLSVCHDVTDRVRKEEEQARLEARVREAQKLENLGLLAGGVAHDFNNLLVGILGNTELALHQVAPGSPLHALLRAIERSSQHASDLTNQLLAFAGKGMLEVDTVDLTAVVRDMRELLNTNARGSIRLRIEGGNEAASIDADAVQIRQIAMNLVSNACEASDEDGGDVVVRTGAFRASREYLDDCLVGRGLEPGAYAFLEVEDSGSGISEASRAQILDPFYTTKFKGRGLGLSAVMGIVTSHGGGLQLDSASGEGATFRAFFPLSAASASGPKPQGNTAAARRGEGTVLVVDDSQTVRDVTAGALELLGFTTLLAPSGHDAVDLLRASKDRVVAAILDLTMPGMDGIETFHALRSLSGNLPVLFMSGHSNEILSERLAGEERIGRMHKPFTVAELSGALQGLLAD